MKMKEKTTNSQRHGNPGSIYGSDILLFMGKDECTCRREHIQWVPL